MNIYGIIILAALLAEYLLSLIANLLNIRALRMGLPEEFAGIYDANAYWKSQQWIASQVPGARVEIFEESEGGNHFMFMENSEKFNRIVKEFLG